MANKRYDQPFCIIGSLGRFGSYYQERRYLPPLETLEIADIESNTRIPDLDKLTNQVNLLQGQIAFLNHKLNEHLEKGKLKQKGKQIDGIPL